MHLAIYSFIENYNGTNQQIFYKAALTALQNRMPDFSVKPF